MMEMDINELIDRLEDKKGPKGLDLSGCDLSGIDLSRQVIKEKVDNWRKHDLQKREGKDPVWYSGAFKEKKLQEEAKRKGSATNRNGITAAHGIDLSGANLGGADLSNANLQNADMIGTNFEGADLRKANFSGARLWEANFRNAHAQGALFKISGDGKRSSSLQNAIFSWTNLERATFERTNFYHVKLEHTNLTKTQVQGEINEVAKKEWGRASQIYSELKINFHSIGRYSDASWAYVQEQKANRRNAAKTLLNLEKEEKTENNLQNMRLKFKRLPSRLAYLVWQSIWELLCGYGEHPQKVLMWLLLLNVCIFPAAYYVTASVLHGDGSAPSVPSYVLFSLRTSTTLVFSDMFPRGWIGHFLASIQAVFSLILYALFIFTLGRRLSGR